MLPPCERCGVMLLPLRPDPMAEEGVLLLLFAADAATAAAAALVGELPCCVTAKPCRGCRRAGEPACLKPGRRLPGLLLPLAPP